MTKINCDMGESFGIYNAGNDEQIMPLIDVANVACGFHASDPNHMSKSWSPSFFARLTRFWKKRNENAKVRFKKYDYVSSWCA